MVIKRKDGRHEAKRNSITTETSKFSSAARRAVASLSRDVQYDFLVCKRIRGVSSAAWTSCDVRVGYAWSTASLSAPSAIFRTIDSTGILS
jgi:hypothetical protein